MKNYELFYIVPNQYTEDEAKKIQEKVDSLLKKFGAVIGFQEFLGKRKLAYPINKVAHGYYIVTEFELEEGANMIKIDNELRLDKEILRAQIIQKHKITEKEIARQKKQRSEASRLEGANPEERTHAHAHVPTHVKPVTVEKIEKKEKEKVSIEKLDEKLDEMLQDDTIV
ncbi:MAG: 30S ribosomal protein S6 [Patescibacteria group bacterium]|jgi:small subunit ribosomal protein S6